MGRPGNPERRAARDRGREATSPRRGRAARLLRSPWLPTLQQPVALLLVALVGTAVVGHAPEGGQERALLVIAAVLTLPGLAVLLARRRRGVFMLAGVAIQWALAQAVLDIAAMLVLIALSAGDWWESYPMAAGVGALALALVALLVVVGAVGVGALRMAVRGGRTDPAATTVAEPGAAVAAEPAPDWSLRGAVGGAGAALVGLVAMAVPYAVLSWGLDVHVTRGIGGLLTLSAFALHADGAAGWVWALRLATVLIDAGLLAVVVLGPLAFWRTVVRPRR